METVPDVTGVLQADAIDLLNDDGFKVGNTDEVWSDTAPVGEVISISPVAGESVAWDTPIDIVISKGPMPITVPDLIGLTEERAKSLLADDLMVVNVEYGRSADVEKGEVYATNPAPGSASTRTGTITLSVSEGKPLVEVPDVRGKSFDDAKAELEALGFVVNGKSVPWNFSSIVFSTDPAAKQMVESGSTIDVEY